MNIAYSVFGEIMTESLGWFLIHSLWQGALIGFLLFVSLILLRKNSAQIRYYLSLAALLMIVISSSLTFRKAFHYASEKQELREFILNQPDQLKDYLSGKDASITSYVKRDKFSRTRVLIRTGIQQNFHWIVSLWFIGLIVYFMRLTGGLYYQHRALRRGRFDLPDEWITKMEELIHRLRIKQKVRIFASSLIKSPLTNGFLKPVILIPLSLCTGLSPEQITAIIAHELAHIKRNDYLFNIIQTLIDTVFFFNPAIWYISGQIRREREHACDNIAIGITEDRINYARALALAQNEFLSDGKLALAFFSSNHSLLKRIKRLNNKITMKTNFIEKFIAIVLVISGLVCLSFMIDGSYAFLKGDDANLSSDPDSLSENIRHKIVIVNTKTDSTGKPVTTKHVYKTKGEELDSLMWIVEKQGDLCRDKEKLIEIVLSESDSASEEMLKHIQLCFMIQEKAELEKEMAEAKKEFEKQRIQILMEQKELEGLNDSVRIEAYIAASKALDEASKALESTDYEVIILKSLQEAEEELQALDLEKEKLEALKEAKEAEKTYSYTYRYKIEDELEKNEKLLQEHQLSLEEKEKILQEKLEELEAELKEVKRQQREQRKNN